MRRFGPPGPPPERGSRRGRRRTARIGHVHLKVADLTRALDFYCGVLASSKRSDPEKMSASSPPAAITTTSVSNTWEADFLPIRTAHAPVRVGTPTVETRHRLLGLKRVSDARNAIGNVMRMAEHSTSTLPLDLTDLTNARFDENGLIQGRTFSVWEVTSGGFRDARIVASSAESTNRHNMRRSAARTLVSQFRPPVAQ